MATNLSTKTLSLRNAEAFANSFVDELTYVFIGDSTPYTDETSPPDIVESSKTIDDTLNSVIAMKKVSGGDVKLSVPRVDWTGNTKYMQYDDQGVTDQLLTGNTSLNTKPMYVLAPSTRNVYKCLSNASGSFSTVEPSGDYSSSAGLVSSGDDGYVWKYMYNIRDNDQFVDSNFIPVPTRDITNQDMSSGTVYSSYSITNSSVVEGELTTVIVTDGGRNYRNLTNVRTFAFETTNTSTSDGKQRSVQITGAFLSGMGLTISDIASVNMSVSGTGLISPDTVIDAVDPVTNKITLSNPVISSSDGSSSNTLSIQTRIYVDGNSSGQEAAVSAVLGANGSISSANVTTFGSGYSDKLNVRVFGTATTNVASLRAVVAPKFGHAFDIGKDLSANSVVVVTKFGDIDSTEGGLVSTDFNFRQVGLIRNAYKYGANTASASPASNSNSVVTVNTTGSNKANNVVRQLTRVFVASGVSFDLNELVYQGTSSTNYTAAGFVHKVVSATLVELTQVQGELKVGTVLNGNTSGASRVVTQLTNPTFEPTASDLLFVDNRTPITRTDGQAESVRLTIRF